MKLASASELWLNGMLSAELRTRLDEPLVPSIIHDSGLGCIALGETVAPGILRSSWDQPADEGREHSESLLWQHG